MIVKKWLKCFILLIIFSVCIYSAAFGNVAGDILEGKARGILAEVRTIETRFRDWWRAQDVLGNDPDNLSLPASITQGTRFSGSTSYEAGILNVPLTDIADSVLEYIRILSPARNVDGTITILIDRHGIGTGGGEADMSSFVNRFTGAEMTSGAVINFADGGLTFTGDSVLEVSNIRVGGYDFNEWIVPESVRGAESLPFLSLNGGTITGEFSADKDIPILRGQFRFSGASYVDFTEDGVEFMGNPLLKANSLEFPSGIINNELWKLDVPLWIQSSAGLVKLGEKTLELSSLYIPKVNISTSTIGSGTIAVLDTASFSAGRMDISTNDLVVDGSVVFKDDVKFKGNVTMSIAGDLEKYETIIGDTITLSPSGRIELGDYVFRRAGDKLVVEYDGVGTGKVDFKTELKSGGKKVLVETDTMYSDVVLSESDVGKSEFVSSSTDDFALDISGILASVPASAGNTDYLFQLGYTLFPTSGIPYSIMAGMLDNRKTADVSDSDEIFYATAGDDNWFVSRKRAMFPLVSATLVPSDARPYALYDGSVSASWSDSGTGYNAPRTILVDVLDPAGNPLALVTTRRKINSKNVVPVVSSIKMVESGTTSIRLTEGEYADFLLRKQSGEYAEQVGTMKAVVIEGETRTLVFWTNEKASGNLVNRVGINPVETTYDVSDLDWTSDAVAVRTEIYDKGTKQYDTTDNITVVWKSPMSLTETKLSGTFTTTDFIVGGTPHTGETCVSGTRESPLWWSDPDVASLSGTNRKIIHKNHFEGIDASVSTALFGDRNTAELFDSVSPTASYATATATVEIEKYLKTIPFTDSEMSLTEPVSLKSDRIRIQGDASLSAKITVIANADAFAKRFLTLKYLYDKLSITGLLIPIGEFQD